MFLECGRKPAVTACREHANTGSDLNPDRDSNPEPYGSANRSLNDAPLLMKVMCDCINSRVHMSARRSHWRYINEWNVKAGWSYREKTAWPSGEKLPPDKHWCLNIYFTTDPRDARITFHATSHHTSLPSAVMWQYKFKTCGQSSFQ